MVIPNWLASHLGEKFFNPCLLHECAKKNEKNIFCLDCCSTIYHHCLPTHRLLQIRRYVYHDFVRLDDVEKLMDCSFVQAYTTNSAKMIFLNQRPQLAHLEVQVTFAAPVTEALQDPYLFCSLSCKVDYLVETEGGVSNHLYECEYLPLSEAPKASDPSTSSFQVHQHPFHYHHCSLLRPSPPVRSPGPDLLPPQHDLT